MKYYGLMNHVRKPLKFHAETT